MKLFLCVLKALIYYLLASTGIGKKSIAVPILDSFWETYLFSHFLDASSIFCFHGVLKPGEDEASIILCAQWGNLRPQLLEVSMN